MLLAQLVGARVVAATVEVILVSRMVISRLIGTSAEQSSQLLEELPKNPSKFWLVFLRK